MTNLTLDVNIIDFPSIPVAMLPHRCSPELLNYSVAKFIMWRKETGLSPVNQSQTLASPGMILPPPHRKRFALISAAALANRFPIIVMA